MDKLRWGILGTGMIARKFGKGLAASETGELHTVGSRSLESAEVYASEYGGRPVEGYDEVLADPEVDAIYISLPHHLHAEWTIRCARAKKAILCEKPFTLNAMEAEQALRVVEEEGVFFMEAFMYRCHPQTLELRRLVRDGAIGQPLVINGEFGFGAGRDWQNFRAVAELGGGALMDVGCYPVSISRWIAGEEPDRCEYVAHLGEKGYDEWGSGCLHFPSGLTATLNTGVHANLRNDVRVYGSEGSISIPSPWFCGEAMILSRGGKEEKVRKGAGLDLYGNEADTVARHLDRKQAPAMTWDDTLGQMRTLDRLRLSAGLRFGDGDPLFR